jgi:hypothetical protein
VAEKQKYVNFLEAELAFSEHLARSLKVLQWMNASLDQVEELAGESNLFEALKVLDGTNNSPFAVCLIRPWLHISIYTY